MRLQAACLVDGFGGEKRQQVMQNNEVTSFADGRDRRPVGPNRREVGSVHYRAELHTNWTASQYTHWCSGREGRVRSDSCEEGLLPCSFRQLVLICGDNNQFHSQTTVRSRHFTSQKGGRETEMPALSCMTTLISLKNHTSSGHLRNAHGLRFLVLPATAVSPFYVLAHSPSCLFHLTA